MDQKTFCVRTKGGKIITVLIRQMEHDPKYTTGSVIPGYGVVVAVPPTGPLATAPVSFYDSVKMELKREGLTIRRKDGEYRVNFTGAAESTAYYTSDLVDALHTGHAMAQARLAR